MTGRRLAVVSCVVCLLIIAGASARAQQADEGAAREIFGLLNHERTQRGLPALKWDDRLAQAAIEHTRQMVQHKQLSHQFNHEPALRQRYVRYDIRLDSAGENVAYDSSVQGAHDAFMNSPPHRENILSPKYDAGGIGVIHSDDRYYVTEDFAHLIPEVSTNAAEDEVSARIAQVRAAQHQRPLRHIALPEVRELACRMARDDRPEPELARSLGGARYFVAYTMTDPKQLPANLTDLHTATDVDRFAVGTCFQSTPQYPNGVYWVMVVFFQGQQHPFIRE